MANSLKDLIGSIDWKKALTGPDARNAAIGAALGGAMLGGAGLMQDRDPEESKFAPVGDALMGAVLGGVAGYGIPKGVALFRDSGSLAPGNDPLKTNYLGWGAGGALAGAGVFGGSLYKTLGRARGVAAEHAKADFVNQRRMLLGRLRQARMSGDTKAIRDLERIVDVALDPNSERAASAIARYRAGALRSLLRGNVRQFMRRRELAKELLGTRNFLTRGYTGLPDLLGVAAREVQGKDSGEALGVARSLWNKLLRVKVDGPTLTHGAHYATRAPWWTLGTKVVGPRGHALARGGKYALGGTALALLAHKLLGPSASNNYKN